MVSRKSVGDFFFGHNNLKSEDLAMELSKKFGLFKVILPSFIHASIFILG